MANWVVAACAAVGAAFRQKEVVHAPGNWAIIRVPRARREWKLVGAGGLSAQFFAGGRLRRWRAEFRAVILQPVLGVAFDAQIIEHLLGCRNDLAVGL
ncbi:MULTISPECIES: hypothetical protein [Mycolicibacter]|uniref:hypothetical protein n=1 Tax=Mycolicibacter TaxID=1073531 RepID=UPI0007EFE006|nr:MULTISPECIES: hypothetical protein [Mycolicibacter]OBJ28513.1 hypothetical protein A5631_20735 [Mycolicibacter heraklionensis]ULP50135.1 hypothetical protein MJO54_00335 [Mycolicibacter virginiensis]